MDRSFNTYGSSKPAVAIAYPVVADHLMTAVVIAAMGALMFAWVHFSPFASIAMAR